MSEKDFFIETMKDELPRFERVFKALPQDKVSHTHHPKSKTAEELVVQMTSEVESFSEFLTSGATDWSKKYEKPKDFEGVFKDFSQFFTQAIEIAEKMNQESWEDKAVAHYAGKEVWSTTRGKMAWGLLLDLIHHRGQLSTYIRPMGGKVPSIYGPSGDTAEG